MFLNAFSQLLITRPQGLGWCGLDVRILSVSTAQERVAETGKLEEIPE
jgi:hypothetical protein